MGEEKEKLYIGQGRKEKKRKKKAGGEGDLWKSKEGKLDSSYLLKAFCQALIDLKRELSLSDREIHTRKKSKLKGKRGAEPLSVKK